MASSGVTSAALPEEAIREASRNHPRPANETFTYGTAGFRMDASRLDPVMFRVGLLAALRSKCMNGKAIGVMVTASHNPERDNGVKLVDPKGEMLEAAWEGHATKLSNAATDDDLIQALKDILGAAKINLAKPAFVIYGHDTRPSCPTLLNALEEGLRCLDTQTMVAGLKTTPQLHYLVRCHNTAGSSDVYGQATEDGYYDKLATAYHTLVKGKPPLKSPLIVDCANGVGAPKLRLLAEKIGTALALKITRDDINTSGALNNQCGADHVKTSQRAPAGLQMKAGERYCSLDGDADRIVFYYAGDDSNFRLLDGDKIATLAAMYIMELVQQAGIDLRVGLVQTAYANGSATAYVERVLKIPITCTATGVKYLHHAAERYDIGVYFEANGHGTVLFSHDAVATITTHEPSSPNQLAALANLKALTELINQTVGDALSDLLLVEVILTHRRWGPAEWDGAYTDLPNRLVKVYVADIRSFTTTNAERTLTSPKGMQGKIDSLVAKFKQGRSFVRPSGTEDCVRVYAEASTRTEADELAYRVAGLIFDECGIGERPPEFVYS